MEFRPVACDRCGTEVLVHKSSYHQTSVQWSGTAAQQCEMLRDAADADRLDVEAHSCPALRASIDRAVVEGRLPVPEDDDDRTFPGLGSPGEARTHRADH